MFYSISCYLTGHNNKFSYILGRVCYFGEIMSKEKIRYCGYCKKQTKQIITDKNTPGYETFRCIPCGSTSRNIQGFHEALM